MKITAAAFMLLFLASPAVAADASQSYADKCFKEADATSDGKISREEARQYKDKKFDQYDTDGDGYHSQDEHRRAMDDLHQKMMGQETSASGAAHGRTHTTGAEN